MNFIRSHKNNLLQREDTYPLRGLAMLMIVIHHIWINMCRYDTDPTPFLTGHIFKPAGQLGTGLFFLISGYGMFLSLIRQHNPGLNYLFPRLWKLIKPYIFCFVLFVLAILVLKRDMFNVVLIKDFVTLTIPNSTTWFLKVIVGIYIITFLMFKLNMPLHLKVLSVIVLCLVYFIIASKTLPLFWWSSILCYPLGILIAWKYDSYSKWGGVFLIFFFALLMITTHLLGISYAVPETLFFSVIAIEIVRYVNIDNRILKFIGTESFSFYLFQSLFLFIGLEIGLQQNWILYGIFVFVATYFLSYVYSTIIKR